MNRQDQMMENYNYHNDRRVCEPAPDQIILYVDDEESCAGEMRLPDKFGVCPICEGKGTHVNPSIDCGGLTQDDFEGDPSFAEDYMSGQYDVKCNYCQGNRVVKVLDRDACTEWQLSEYEIQCEDEANEDAMHRAELAMGC